jgi:hypothetical protein
MRLSTPQRLLIGAGAAICLAVVFTQGGVWNIFSSKTGVGDPSAQYTPPNLPQVNITIPSIGEVKGDTNGIPNEPTKGGENISRYKKAKSTLEKLPVKDVDFRQKYDRKADFGDGWLDIDNNGCDTRNDILKRDMLAYDKNQQIKYKDNKNCKIESGSLYDPYTNSIKQFQYGTKTSSDVQVDHMVALKDAWLTGAQDWDYNKRVQYANSPDVLISSDGKTNMAKGDGNCAGPSWNLTVGTCDIWDNPTISKVFLVWQIPNYSWVCDYESKLVEIRQKWGLFVTSGQKQTYGKVLDTCIVGDLFNNK